MSLQLVEVAARPLAARPRGAYVGHALTHPLSTLTMLAGVSLGIYLSSAAVVLSMVMVAVFAGWTLAGSAGFQRSIDEYLQRQKRLERRHRREEALESAGVGRDQLTELTTLCEEIRRVDGGRTDRRFELEDLLDHYVDVAIAHERCLRALRATDRGDLVRQLREHLPARGEQARGRRVLVERRLRCWDECRGRADRLGEELATLVELIRLLAQRAACPDPLLDADALARRLSDLDEDDSALAELCDPAPVAAAG